MHDGAHQTLVGIDGCAEGWICVTMAGRSFRAFVALSLEEILKQVTPDVVAIDVPIGLADVGERLCDTTARKILRPPRASSVFSVPVRATLSASIYSEACERHFQADGRRMSKQAFAILPKIREANDLLSTRPKLRSLFHEIHPELCFALWNGGRAMLHSKKKHDGRAERERLIETRWPGLRMALERELRIFRYEADDLNDALAALWTADRISTGAAALVPPVPTFDSNGITMQMRA